MFYCPIHHADSNNIVTITSHVDATDYHLCDVCLEAYNKTFELSNWFYNTQKKIPKDLKEEIKKQPIEFYKAERFFENVELHSYYCFRYLNNNFTRINIYNYIRSFTSMKVGNRISIQTYNKIRYDDLVPAGYLQLELSKDDKYLTNLLK